jgi:hypothetical protein
LARVILHCIVNARACCFLLLVSRTALGSVWSETWIRAAAAAAPSLLSESTKMRWGPHSVDCVAVVVVIVAILGVRDVRCCCCCSDGTGGTVVVVVVVMVLELATSGSAIVVANCGSVATRTACGRLDFVRDEVYSRVPFSHNVRTRNIGQRKSHVLSALSINRSSKCYYTTNAFFDSTIHPTPHDNVRPSETMLLFASHKRRAKKICCCVYWRSRARVSRW